MLDNWNTSPLIGEHFNGILDRMLENKKAGYGCAVIEPYLYSVFYKTANRSSFSNFF